MGFVTPAGLNVPTTSADRVLVVPANVSEIPPDAYVPEEVCTAEFPAKDVCVPVLLLIWVRVGDAVKVSVAAAPPFAAT